MQFIYLGEAKFYEERINEFMSVVNNLEIKDPSTGVESNDSLTDNTYDVTTNIRGIGREF